jgi:isocitrate dehydrogenase kinase/phosphatase
MIPLDIYVREMDEAAVMEAVLDYGQALKDLAATNIFPGDILIKNFGVTRHRRVIFYDYDEVTLLTDCRFRRIPQTSDYADEFAAEPWFFVGKNDIFPEEFKTFLGFHEPYREAFCQAYEDLFRIDFWKSMQKRHQASEVMDIFPYKQSMRIR